MKYDPRNDAYSHSDKDVMNFAQAISSGKGFYDVATADTLKSKEMLETEMQNDPYFLALDKSDMGVDVKMPK